MSAPRDIDPHTPGPGDEDHDPTGVRALLASLPDPGPMPPELVRRISESLAAEQNGHAHADSSSEGYAGVTPPPSLASVAAASSDRSRDDGRRVSDGTAGDEGDGSGGEDGGEGGTVHRFPRTPHDRPTASPLRRLPAIAVAASVVVLAGAVVLGVLATQTGLGGTDSLDAAVRATMSAADAGSADDEAAGGAAAEDSSGGTADSGAAETGAEESAPLASPLEGDAAAMAAAPVAFLSSGAIVTTANVAGHAKAMRDGSTGVVDEASRAVMSDSPVGTAEGAADCIGELLDRPMAEVAALLTAVDFVRHDGSDAALILVREPLEATPGSGSTDDGAGSGEASTAYLVPVDCGAGRAWTLQPPVRLDF
ncbi:hypothetical protein GA707_06280 [Nostocoides sp. F2B08]|uniref:hypothetical protein n=1 Tax=Nostocoides sp. F2B08 TaxID=2653936 RepID=UPI00126378B9|nr:hypothetical protein [Tetrasphaera sp. F2B08]KAB7745521.1 hypothetical protein GA707_06280 [Tetrasphaera sp. F2B08]